MPAMCSSCKSAVRADDKFCSNCAHALVAEPMPCTSVNVGDYSSKNAIGNTLTYGSVQIADHIDNKYGAFLDERPPQVERALTKELELFGCPVKTTWVVMTEALSIFADLIGVSSVAPSASLSLMLGGSGLVFAGMWFQQCRFLRIGPFSLEVDKRRNIHLTRIRATCPRCSDRLELQPVLLDGQRTTMLVCSRNPRQHQYICDPTELEDLN